MSQITLGLSSVSSQSPILLSLGFVLTWILVEIVQTFLQRPVCQKDPSNALYYLLY